MKKWPTMPGDPGQPMRVMSAGELDEDTTLNYRAMKEYVHRAIIEITRMSDSDTKLPKALTDFLLYGFVAETGLQPKDTMIVQRRQMNGDIYYAFEERCPKTMNIESMLRDQSKKILEYERTIRELQEENRDLRRRR